MKFLVDNWVLLLVAFTSGAMLVWPLVSRGGGAGAITPNAAVMVMNREKAIVVDVGETEEFAAGHVVGARNVPLGQLEQRLGEVAKNKALPLVFVDPTGARSSRAVGIAQKLGYERAHAVSGGLKSWKEANLPLEKG